MDLLVLLDTIAQNWWTTAEGIGSVIALVTGGIGTVAGIVMKCINEYRRSHHECPKHCITKKPLKPKANGKPKA